MFAKVMTAQVYRVYRLRLEALLQIPIDAADQDMHELIAAGFCSASVKAWCEQSIFSADALNQVIPISTLRHRLARGRRLTLGESDRLFRLAHVMAMTEAIFGSKAKARRWLSEPKQRFASITPIALLSTYLGTRLVEAFLIELAEGADGQGECQ